MLNFTDIELVRSRLVDTSVPSPVCREYLTLLGNLNALSLLLAPVSELDEPGGVALDELVRRHLKRRLELETAYPPLAIASRPAGWRDN